MEKLVLSAFLTVTASMVTPAFAASSSAGKCGDPGGIFVKGRPTPGLELPTIDGRATVNLGALVGRKVIVLQFASW